MTQPAYRKLTTRHRRLTGYSQLWMGDDHLLLVRSARLVENYQRFALKDVLAIVVSDGPDLRALQAVGVIASLAWASLALTVPFTFARAFFVITGVLGLILAIIDIWRGPRCRCVLHTAVSKELLSPVSRRKTSERFMAQVLPAIEAIQGPVDLAQLQSASANPYAGGMAAQPHPPEVRHGRSYVPEILSGLLAASAALVWIVLRTAIPNASSLLPTIYLAELVMAGVTVAQRRAMRVPLVIWGVVTLVLVVADIAMVSGVAAFAALMNASGADEGHRELRSFWLSNRETAIVSTCWRLAAGVAGGVLCYFDRRASARENPV